MRLRRWRLFRPKNLWKMLKETYKCYSEHDTWSMGAALSYYTIFSLAPILIIVIALAGIFFGPEAVRGEIFGQIKGVMGADAAEQVQTMVKSAYHPGKSHIATAIAVILLIFGATTVFNQLQTSINTIWEVKPKPRKGYLKYALDRVLSFSVIIGVGFVLLVSLVINAAMVALTNYLMRYLPEYSVYLFRALDIVLTLGITTLLFAMIYKLLPDAKVNWSEVWVGAIFTAILFSIGRFLIGLYLGKSNIGTTYGAAGSIVIVLAWVNYTSQILFFGAEFTQIYARHLGRVIQPNIYSVRVKTVAVVQDINESANKFQEKIEKVNEVCAVEPVPGKPV